MNNNCISSSFVFNNSFYWEQKHPKQTRKQRSKNNLNVLNVTQINKLSHDCDYT